MSRLKDALFDDLKIVPVCTRLLVRRSSASPSVFRDLSPGREHRFTIAAFPIGGHRWWPLGMAALFELGHQRESHFFLRFGTGTAHTQPTVYRNRRAPPE